MASNKISLTMCESGDWEIVEYDGCFERSGHSISNYDWCDLLSYLGYNVEVNTISDEEMESLC